MLKNNRKIVKVPLIGHVNATNLKSYQKKTYF